MCVLQFPQQNWHVFQPLNMSNVVNGLERNFLKNIPLFFTDFTLKLRVKWSNLGSGFHGVRTSVPEIKFFLGFWQK